MYQIFLFKMSHVLMTEVSMDSLRALPQLCFHTHTPVLRGTVKNSSHSCRARTQDKRTHTRARTHKHR